MNTFRRWPRCGSRNQREESNGARGAFLVGLALAGALVLSGCGSETDTQVAGATDAIDAGSTDARTTADVDQASDAVAPDIATEDTDAGEDPTQVLFEPDHVVEVSIEIEEGHWDALRETTRDFSDILFGEDCLSHPPDKIFEYYPAQVTVDGITVDNVGVRKKGFFGSLDDKKPSLKIKFSEYDQDQRLHGMQRMTLNNNRQDPSQITTCLTYGVFRAAGYPAPRCNFAHVVVNGKDLGVYSHVESVKKAYLRRHFDDDDGNLYEGTLSDFDPEWKGSFEKKTNKTENDWSDVDAAVAALQMEGFAGMAAIETIFDVDAFLTFWALEILVAHWDGYAGNRNNFYIYRDPARDQFLFLPWGPDSTFASLRNPIKGVQHPPSVVADGLLAHRLYKDPVGQERYITRLLELLDSVWDEAHLLDEVDRMSELIRPYLPAYIQPATTSRTEAVRDFISAQREEVLASLDPTPPVWTDPPPEPPCWDINGALDISFEAAWGTLDHEEPFEQGNVTIESYTIDGAPVEFFTSGVTAGLDTKDPLDVTARLAIFLVVEDSFLEILVFTMDPELVAPNSTLPIAKGGAKGYRIRLSPPTYSDFELLGFVGVGEIRFDQGDRSPGGAITGSVKGQIIGVDP